MAKTELEVTVESKNRQLKHLGFVRIVVIQTFAIVSNLYEYAKQNSGPLRSAVGTVENTVTTVLGPVYNKLKDVPDDVLVFVDKKVNEGTCKFNKHAPSFAKHLVDQAKDLIQKVTHKAGKVASEAQLGGPQVAIHYIATESKHFVLINLVKLWNGLNNYPSFHALAEMAIPTATYWSKKYNHMIKAMTQKGYNFVRYLPLIPVEEITKTFKQEGNVKGDNTTFKEQRSKLSNFD